jgi:cellulose synthase/poly-beta-1,6-N-acetylglucosamine synthase-like glycosyltransferase
MTAGTKIRNRRQPGADITVPAGTDRAATAVPEKNLAPLLTTGQRFKYQFGIALWLLCLVFFWQWWLQPEHNIGTIRYLFTTACLAWLCLLPFYYFAMFIGARVPTMQAPAEGEARVAMVVTKTPSEPFQVVRKTLEAMLRQDYPHDTWLADEDPEPSTIAWCRQNGVMISTRKGREDYHRLTWPRRTRCKEGNLAFFYDKYGYQNYDFVSQLDADHVPGPTYLRHMLEPFGDPGVGYVSAPSICNKNAVNSWAARSRLYAEAMFHGTLQAGYSGGWAPMCIGSHYAVRTAALKEIGGLGPELAEDHSTSMIMNAHGWRGVHAIDAIASGDGPATFADLATQEFQWSRSLASILLQHTPRYFSRLTPRLKFQFLFCQLWYPLFAVFMASMFLMPILALSFGVNFVGVTFPAFVLHMLPMPVVLIVLAYQLKRDRLYRPIDAKVLSWERTFFHCAQWPWVFAGTIMAVRDWATGSFVDFRITPKGTQSADVLPLRVLLPYALLSLASAAPVLAFPNIQDAKGFFILAAVNALFYAILLALILVRHCRENGISWKLRPYQISVQGALVAVTISLATASFPLRGVEGIEAIAHGAGPLTVTKVTYIVSGAGMDRYGAKRTRLQFGWK